MELRQLKYFVSVAELEHFGRAAKQLHIAQPALSRQIKQLEEEIGVELFERLSRGVRLTSAGKVLLQHSRHLLAGIDQMLALTRLASEGKSGHLRIGFAEGSTYSGLLPTILRQFRLQRPQVVLQLVPANSTVQGELLSKEAIDVGFVYWLPNDRSGIEFFELDQEEIVLALPKSNPMAKRSAVRLPDLTGQPFVWVPRIEGPAFYDRILSRCNRAGLTLNVVQEGNNESTLLSLVAAEIGATFIIESAKRRKPENVVLVPIEDLGVTVSLKAVWRSHDKTPSLSEFLSFVRQSI